MAVLAPLPRAAQVVAAALTPEVAAEIWGLRPGPGLFRQLRQNRQNREAAAGTLAQWNPAGAAGLVMQATLVRQALLAEQLALPVALREPVAQVLLAELVPVAALPAPQEPDR